MKVRQLLIPAVAVLTMAPAFAVPALAQQHPVRPYRPNNAQATIDMQSRLSAAIDRVRVTEQHGTITPARSMALRRQLASAQRDMARLKRQQGFVSAAELASYGRLVESVDAELGAGPRDHSYGNDGLPSPEVIAFQKLDARLHYRNARIEYDGRNCAVYQGIGRDGRTHREPLLDEARRPLCTRR